MKRLIISLIITIIIYILFAMTAAPEIDRDIQRFVSSISPDIKNFFDFIFKNWIASWWNHPSIIPIRLLIILFATSAYYMLHYGVCAIVDNRNYKKREKAQASFFATDIYSEIYNDEKPLTTISVLTNSEIISHYSFISKDLKYNEFSVRQGIVPMETIKEISESEQSSFKDENADKLFNMLSLFASNAADEIDSGDIGKTKYTDVTNLNDDEIVNMLLLGETIEQTSAEEEIVSLSDGNIEEQLITEDSQEEELMDDAITEEAIEEGLEGEEQLESTEVVEESAEEEVSAESSEEEGLSTEETGEEQQLELEETGEESSEELTLEEQQIDSQEDSSSIVEEVAVVDAVTDNESVDLQPEVSAESAENVEAGQTGEEIVETSSPKEGENVENVAPTKRLSRNRGMSEEDFYAEINDLSKKVREEEFPFVQGIRPRKSFTMEDLLAEDTTKKRQRTKRYTFKDQE